MDNRPKGNHRRRLRAIRLAAAALVALAAVVAVLVSTSSASSYSGSGDWNIPAGTNETVVGESINVVGTVFVRGNLTLINSSLRVSGAASLNPPFEMNEVNITGSLLTENSTLTILGNVTIHSRMDMFNSTLNVSYFFPPPFPPAQFGKLNVYGYLNLTHTLLNFDLVIGALVNVSVPNGMRVSATGRVLLQDLDNSSATPADASVITAGNNGSYSVFQNGSTFTMLNSVGEHLGWNGYPGLEFNGSAVRVEGSTFQSSNTSISVNGCAGFKVADSSFLAVLEGIRLRNCSSVELLRTVFDTVSLPLNATGGAGYTVDQVRLLNHAVGLLFRNVSSLQLTALSSDLPDFPPLYSAWAARGTVMAFDNGTNVTVSNIWVNGTYGPGGTPPSRIIWANNISFFTISNVDGFAVDAVGDINGSQPLQIMNVHAAGIGGGLRIANSVDVVLDSLLIAGNATIGLSIEGCSNVTMAMVDIHAYTGLDIEGSNGVTLSAVNITSTQWGLNFYEGSGLSAAQFTIASSVSGIELYNSSVVTLDDFSVSFGAIGLQAAFAQGTFVTNAEFTTPVGVMADQWLRAINVETLEITDVNYTGVCDVAGSVDGAIVLFLERVNVSTCGKGLSVSSAFLVTVRSASFAGAWNGSALGLFGVTNALVEDCDLTGSNEDALLIAASSDIRIQRVDGSRAGAGGLFLVLSGGVEVLNSTFVGSGGTALSIVNATGPTRLYRIVVTGHFSGIEVMGSPDVTIEDVESSSNGIDGVFFDAQSLRASLRNITLSRNGRNGLSMDAVGATFVDGNLSLNGGDAIAMGPGVRMDWTVQVYASLTDDDARLTGNLDTAPGSWFWATRAHIRMDALAGGVPPPVLSFGTSTYVFFDNLLVDAANESVPYSITFNQGARVSINGSRFVGAAMDDPDSAIRLLGAKAGANVGTFVMLASQVTGFYYPLEAQGGSVDVRWTNFTANTEGPHIDAAAVFLLNVTAEESGGDGITISTGRVFIEGLYLLNNQGVGARILDATVDALLIEARGNLKGGLYVSCPYFNATGLNIVSNVLFGVRVENSNQVFLTVLGAGSNTGASLMVAATEWITVTDSLFSGPGGRGIDLDNVTRAWIVGGTISSHSGFGLVANNVENLSVTGTRFESNAVAQLDIRGFTVAWVTNVTLVNSPGDAVVVSGDSRSTFTDVSGSATFGRIYALDFAYAYQLNSTMAPPRADGLAQVDVAWNVRVRVLLLSGAPGVGSVVDVRDALRAPVASAVADGTGTTPLITLLTKSVFASPGTLVFTPHAFAAMNTGSGSARANVTIDRYMLITLGFDDVDPVTTATLGGIEGENGWYVGAVSVFLESLDEGGYGVTLYWRIDGASVWESADSALNFSSTLFTVDKEGTTTVEFYSVDGMGNFESHQEVVILIDLAPPIVAFESLPASVTQSDFTVRWNGSDGGSGIRFFVIEVSKDGGPFTVWQNRTTDTAAVFHAADGRYQFRMSAWDIAGQSGAPAYAQTEVALYGTVHVRLTDRNGRPLPDAQLTAAGGNITALGTGEFSVRFPPGAYTLQASARGFYARTVAVNVSVHNMTELGDVVLEKVPEVETTQDVSALVGGIILAVIVAGVAAVLFLRSRKGRQGPDK